MEGDGSLKEGRCQGPSWRDSLQTPACTLEVARWTSVSPILGLQIMQKSVGIHGGYTLAVPPSQPAGTSDYKPLKGPPTWPAPPLG